jgi:hypothetical protein
LPTTAEQNHGVPEAIVTTWPWLFFAMSSTNERTVQKWASVLIFIVSIARSSLNKLTLVHFCNASEAMKHA